MSERPPWWPENEPWPPEGRGRPWWGGPGSRGGRRGGPPWGPWGPRGAWRHGRPSRGGMARRFGCFVVLLGTVLVSVGVLVLWLLGSLFGLIDGGAGGPGGLLGDLARAAGLVVLLAGGAALIVGIRLARGIGPPLADLAEAAERVENGDYTTRVAVPQRGPGELRDLARAFNTMTTRLEHDEAERRRLLADVSHELRTPLAVIRGNLEGVVDGVYPADEAHLGPILEETRVMSRLIDDLRTLSLAEAGTLTLHREPTDLGVLATEALASFRPAAAAVGTRLEADIADDLPLLDVDPIRMREVLANLVSNALRHVPPGGWIGIAGRRRGGEVGDGDGGRHGGVRLEVADDGPGIPPDLLPTVFERFSKGPESRGSGLGLAIARAIVVAHGGAIAAEARDGGGTRIVIDLPAD